MPNDVMKPQTKNVTMCPPRTCDHAAQPPFGGGSIDVTRVMSKHDASSCFSIGVCRSWVSAVSGDLYVSCCSMMMGRSVREEFAAAVVVFVI